VVTLVDACDVIELAKIEEEQQVQAFPLEAADP
jgi:hypothetical protein